MKTKFFTLMENIFGKPVELQEDELDPTLDETIEYFKNFAIEHKTQLILLLIGLCVARVISHIL